MKMEPIVSKAKLQLRTSAIRIVKKRDLGMAGYRRARDTIRFIETGLLLWPDQPMLLMPWQKRWILEVFKEIEVTLENERTGKRWKEIRRPVGTALVSIPRKNGKSGFISALIPALMFGPLYERGMEITCAATKKDQARIVFDDAARMMRISPVFTEDGSFEFYRNSMFSEQHGVKCKPVASREAGAHGLNSNVILLDEIARLPDLSIYDTLKEATSTRTNSLIICFSTMDGRVDNPMTELIGSVEALRLAGIEHDDWHVLDCKGDLEEDPDPLSEENIFRANISAPFMPTLLETLEKERRVASISDRALARWLTVRLNIAGESDKQFINPIKWKNAASETGRERYDEWPTTEAVVLGVDLSRSRDLTAIGLWFPDRKLLDCMFFLPESLIAEYEARHRLPFRQWVEKGDVIACPGPIVDYDVVAGFLANISDRFDVLKMRYDTWGFENLREAMRRADVQMPTEDVRMGVYSMNNYMIKFENMIDAGALFHTNKPLLNFCVHSTAAEQDKRSITGVRKPVKAYHNSLIDGCIASMLAVGQSAKGERLTRDQIMLPFADEDDAIGAAEYDYDDGGDYNFDD